MNYYALYRIPFLDQREKQYKTILSINAFPKGPLSSMVTRLRYPKLSPFKEESPRCVLAITSPGSSNQNQNLMTIEQFPELLGFLSNHDYQIDFNVTKLIQKNNMNPKDKTLVCYISYKNWILLSIGTRQ